MSLGSYLRLRVNSWWETLLLFLTDKIYLLIPTLPVGRQLLTACLEEQERLLSSARTNTQKSTHGKGT